MAKPSVSAATHAAQRGAGLHKWVNDKTASGSEEVLDDVGLYHDLAPGEVVMITGTLVDLHTLNDECEFELVCTDEPAGAGTPTALWGEQHLATPAAKSAHAPHALKFCPPIRVAYADGARSITFRINGSDSSVSVNCAWTGYRDLSL